MAESSENPLPLSKPSSDGCKAHEWDSQDVRSPPKRSRLDEAGHGSPGGGEPRQCEVEVVETDEFEFLDGMTRLATLEAELDDVKTGLKSRHGLDRFIPFRLLNPWGHRIVSVTDLSGGLWCEVNVEYRKLHRHLRNSQEWKKMEEKGTPVVLKTETMKKGCEVHLKKELEVHEIVKVETVTKEDRAAVQLINTYNQLSVIKTGSLEREVSVFGDPFDSGVLVRGIIDQLQYCPEANELILTDNKTRRTKSLPSSEQKKGTSFQLMMYKYLLDNMCLGITKADLLYKHLKLDRDSYLTQGTLDHIVSCGLSALFGDELSSPQQRIDGGGSEQEELDNSQKGVSRRLRFGRVVDTVLGLIAGLGLPLVGQLTVHYEHQESGESLGVDSVDYDESWMQAELHKRLEFWEGSRPAEGVDIESAWKCCSCQFKDICTWRLKKQLETSPAAKISSP